MRCFILSSTRQRPSLSRRPGAPSKPASFTETTWFLVCCSLLVLGVIMAGELLGRHYGCASNSLLRPTQRQPPRPRYARCIEQPQYLVSIAHHTDTATARQHRGHHVCVGVQRVQALAGLRSMPTILAASG